MRAADITHNKKESLDAGRREAFDVHAVVQKDRSTSVYDSRTAVIDAEKLKQKLEKRNAPLIPTSKEKERQLRKLFDESPGVGVEIQQLLLLRAMFVVGQVTAMEAQRHLDIRHPPARILNLTHDGFCIGRRWVRQYSERGIKHRTMEYFLLAQPTDA